METLLVPILGIICLLILFSAGVPVAFSMLIIGFVGIMVNYGFDSALLMLGSTSYHAAANWFYIVIPMFILMGEFAGKTGIVDDIFMFFKTFFGWIPGSLAVGTILTSAVFAFATGSSIAATAIMGRIALPQMVRDKYDRKYALQNILAGGMLGVIIPPSIGLILYAIITEQSIAKLLVSGVCPGLLYAALFIVMAIVKAVRNPVIAPRCETGSSGEKLRSFRKIWPMLAVITMVLGSIYTGFATVTEAASVGAFGVFLLGVLRGQLNIKKISRVLKRSVILTATIFILIIAVGFFSRFLNLMDFSQTLTRLASESKLSPTLIMACVYCIFVIFGCFVDPTSLILLLVPVVFPVIVNLGYDPVWFGVVTVLLAQIGQITPPVGICVYVLQGVTGEPLQTCFAAARDVFFLGIILLIVITFFPGIATWLGESLIF